MTTATVSLDSKVRLQRFLLFGSLYFVQGVSFAYLRNFGKAYLAGFDIDADLIGTLAVILLLPFIFKIFIGMLSDSVNFLGLGYRKPYIVMGLLLASVGFSAGAFITPDQGFWLFAAGITVGSFAVALFDSCTDGLAIDSTPPNEESTIQSLMTGSRAFGLIAFSVIFGYVATAAGYAPVFLIIAAFMLVPLIWVLPFNEAPRQDPDHKFQWGAFKSLASPAVLLFMGYAVLYSVVSWGLDGLIPFYMSEVFDAPEAALGNFGAVRGVGAVIGAVIGGLAMNRLGSIRASYLAVGLIVIGALGIALSPTLTVLLVTGFVWGLMWGFQEVVFVALAMHISDARIAATMFALMMAVSNIGTAIGEGVATGLTDDVGFTPIFFGMAALNILVLPLLMGFFRLAKDRFADEGKVAPAEASA